MKFASLEKLGAWALISAFRLTRGSIYSLYPALKSQPKCWYVWELYYNYIEIQKSSNFHVNATKNKFLTKFGWQFIGIALKKTKNFSMVTAKWDKDFEFYKYIIARTIKILFW